MTFDIDLGLEPPFQDTPFAGGDRYERGGENGFARFEEGSATFETVALSPVPLPSAALVAAGRSGGPRDGAAAALGSWPRT